VRIREEIKDTYTKADRDHFFGFKGKKTSIDKVEKAEDKYMKLHKQKHSSQFESEWKDFKKVFKKGDSLFHYLSEKTEGYLIIKDKVCRGVFVRWEIL